MSERHIPTGTASCGGPTSPVASPTGVSRGGRRVPSRTSPLGAASGTPRRATSSDRDAAFTSELVHGARAIGTRLGRPPVDRPLADLDPRVLVWLVWAHTSSSICACPTTRPVSATVDVARDPDRWSGSLRQRRPALDYPRGDAERGRGRYRMKTGPTDLCVTRPRGWSARSAGFLEAHGYSTDELRIFSPPTTRFPRSPWWPAQEKLMSVGELADGAEDILDVLASLPARSPRALSCSGRICHFLRSDGRSGCPRMGSPARHDDCSAGPR